MNIMSSIRKEFVATNLRSQLSRLSSVLGTIEEESRIDCDYAYASLREIEISLRQIRKLCGNN